MKFTGASGLSRVALNPECGWQVVMFRSGKSEPDFYKTITGSDFPYEYGERLSQRRRGAKFERNAYANNAAQLRTALAPLIGVPKNDLWVRHMEDEVPGFGNVSRIKRFKRTMDILRDHVHGVATAHILIQPQLRLTISGLPHRPGLWIAPDVLFIDGTANAFRPADLKSFVVRGNQVEPADLEKSRLQVAVQSLALQECLRLVDDPRPFDHTGGFIFATPYGLAPHEPQLESLDGSVDRMEKALAWLAHHSRTIERVAAADGVTQEHLLLDSIPFHFQERCASSCALADLCRERHRNKAHQLGDAAVEILGEDIDLDRATALMAGAEPESDAEREIATALDALIEPFDDVRRTA